MSAKTILLADDDSAIRTVLTQALNRAGYSVRSTATATALWRWVSEGQGDAVLTDVVLPDENAFDVIPRIKKLRPNLPIIVMSAQNTIMTAITAAERGAYDYLPKPFDLNALVQTVGRALEQSSKPSVSQTRAPASENLPIVGRSPAMQDIYRIIARLTQTDLTVMIVGESGTGKELVARALHDYGRRRKGAFVAVNMAAIPRELIESELFGHEKGAFTGATSRMAGRFEQAEGGTLFLDEIGDMPLEAQTRLLRVLQQSEYTSVGGVSPIKTNVRIIAATHRDLRQLITQGQFREDLFFRLNVVPLQIPALRERLEDLPDLTRHFLERASTEGLPRKEISQDAVAALQILSLAGKCPRTGKFDQAPDGHGKRRHDHRGFRDPRTGDHAGNETERQPAHGFRQAGGILRKLSRRIFCLIRPEPAARRALRAHARRNRAAAAARQPDRHQWKPAPRR